MAILRNDTTVRSADGQTTSPIITAANIGNYGISTTSTYYIGTTQNVFNRASGAQTLTGVSIDGNAATVTNGVYTTGTQTIGGAKTFSDGITVNTATYNTFTKPSPSTYQTVALFGSTGGGLFLTTDNPIIGVGAYYNTSWIATATSGRQIDFAGGNFTFSAFSGATIGGAASWGTVAQLSSAGVFSATGDFRAPVFYDTNNTAYYCDPASVSNLNAVTLNRSGSDGYLTLPGSVTVSNVSGAEMVIRGLSQLRFSNSTSWDWNSWAGLRYDNAGTTIYLGGPAATGIFTQNATPPTVTVSFVGTNNVTSDSNFKAPIFYDSANTAYYLDPNNTGTSLNTAGAVVAGTYVYSTSYLQAGNNNIYPNGFTNTLILNAGNSAGNSWITGISIAQGGNIGIGTASPAVRFVVNGGTVNTSTYTTSEARIADGSLHLMKTVAGGVFEAIRAMNMDTTAGTTVRVLAASTSDPFNNGNGGKVFIDAIRTSTNMDLAFSLNDVAGAAAVERVRFMGSGNVGIGTASPSQKLHVVGTGFASTDFRAPIFYDSDNTTYYLDPNASTSGNLFGVLKQNDGKFVRDSYFRTISGTGDYYVSGASGWYTVASITLTSNCTGGVLYGTLYDNRYDGADTYQIAIVARAECDFQTNNESHYVNVGCTILGSTNITNYQSKIRVLLVASSANSRTYEVQFFETSWNRDTWQLETGGSPVWTIYSTAQAPGTSTGTARVFYISNKNADNIRANTASYSPIYYDSNDTSYYLDAAGTSRLNTTRIGNINVGSGTYLNTITPIGDTNINLSSPSGAFYFDTFPRMPGFYDSANTAYYIDPASTSIVNSFKVYDALYFGDYTTYLSQATPYLRITTANGYGNFGPANSSWFHMTTDRPNFYMAVGLHINGDLFIYNTQSQLTSTSVRAPIFYDSGDTTYYLDPANTGTALAIAGNAGVGTASPTLSSGKGIHINSSSGHANLKLQSSGRTWELLSTTGAYFSVYDTTGGADRLAVTSAGNVGVATTSADTNLQVVGHVHVGNQTTFDNTGGWNKTIYLDGTVHARMRIIGSAFASGKNSQTETNIWVDNSVAPYSGLTTNAGSFTINAGFTTLTNSARSPIFYDSDNTSYYLDPASTSNLVGLTVANTITGSISGNAATATTSLRSTIEDTRAAQRTPNDYDDYRASYEFTNAITGLGDWHSAFTLQGWHNGYAAWQIIGPASTSAHENFYLRSGVNTTWNAVRTILHSGNYNSYSPTLTGTGASGTWSINVTGNAGGSSASCTGNAATATTSSQLGGVAAANYVRNDVDGTDSTALFRLTTITKSLTITTSWLDTGIVGANLATGCYMISVYVDNYAVNGGHYQETYTGMMSWFSTGTNATDYDEIVLHKSGHAPNGAYINLRTIRQLSGSTNLKLQIISSVSTSGASNYVFKFRRLI